MSSQLSFFIAILIYTTTVYSTSALHSISQSRNFENSSSYLYVSSENIGEYENFGYLICNEKPTDPVKEKHCEVFLEWYHIMMPNVVIKKSCKVNYKYEIDIEKSTIKINWISNDIVLVSWIKSIGSDPTGFGITQVLQVSDCNIIKEVVVDLKIYEGIDVQEVELPNKMVKIMEIDHCSGQICRMRTGYKGMKLSAWFERHENTNNQTNIYSMTPMDQIIPYLIVEKLRDETTRLSIVGYSDKVIHRDFQGTTKVEVSLHTGDSIGICIPYKNNSRLRCGIYDYKLRPKLKMNFEIGYNPMHGSMRNTKEGGFLLMTANCIDNSCSNKKDNFELNHIDPEGQLIASFKFNDLNCQETGKSGNVLMKSYVNKKGHYCFARLCSSLKNFNISIKCLDKNELKFTRF